MVQYPYYDIYMVQYPMAHSLVRLSSDTQLKGMYEYILHVARGIN